MAAMTQSSRHQVLYWTSKLNIGADIVRDMFTDARKATTTQTIFFDTVFNDWSRDVLGGLKHSMVQGGGLQRCKHVDHQCSCLDD